MTGSSPGNPAARAPWAIHPAMSAWDALSAGTPHVAPCAPDADASVMTAKHSRNAPQRFTAQPYQPLWSRAKKSRAAPAHCRGPERQLSNSAIPLLVTTFMGIAGQNRPHDPAPEPKVGDFDFLVRPIQNSPRSPAKLLVPRTTRHADAIGHPDLGSALDRRDQGGIPVAVAEQISGEADGAPGPRLKQVRSRDDRFHREENAAVTGETTPRTQRPRRSMSAQRCGWPSAPTFPEHPLGRTACGRIREERQVRGRWRSRSISPPDRRRRRTARGRRGALQTRLANAVARRRARGVGHGRGLHGLEALGPSVSRVASRHAIPPERRTSAAWVQ